MALVSQAVHITNLAEAHIGAHLSVAIIRAWHAFTLIGDEVV
jgi:hypothetical protein